MFTDMYTMRPPLLFYDIPTRYPGPPPPHVQASF